MGAQQSTSGSDDERVFSSSRPISFSQDLVNHLEDVNVSSPETSAHRQGTLDAHVRARIAAELERLQAEEQSVREQIEAALERENLDRETALAKGGEADGEAEQVVESADGEVEAKNLASSVALQSELEEVQRKVERFHQRRQLDEYPEVRDAKEAVIQCYQSNPTRPLDCVDSVDRFKRSVAQVEKAFVDSLRA
ncbi:hypothetical protein DL93DRAFT_2210044 [Clavulina sp. PMI_390]|nr:hypothetical protein DL93DRAFT_2210044 [Clavulina sp. PMI_390]